MTDPNQILFLLLIKTELNFTWEVCLILNIN